ncbi:MAG: hydroxymethylbilane synthase [Acidimicrobiia bacterium]
MSDLVLATRGSALALAQTRLVAEALQAAHRGLTVTVLEVTTQGDRDRTTPVTELTEMGAFVRAVQQAVLDGSADLAVHSCKDLPTAGPDGLVAFYPKRAAPWDVLCGTTLDDLPRGGRVGTGSPRRAAQLGVLRPDVEMAEIRGNVGTRLDQVDRGDFDAIVLAEAGLRRLGMEDRIAHRFSLEEMVPAPAQAAIAVEGREGSSASELAAAIDDATTRRAVEAERSLLARTGAGCRAALGALATTDDSGITLTAFVHDEAGTRRARVTGSDPDEASRLAQERLGL